MDARVVLPLFKKALCGALILSLTAGSAIALPTARATWTTLGTNGGPIPSSTRSEPSNLLRVGDQAILVDAGDGAAGQLAKAGVTLPDLRNVILSHLHFDHTGGLFALISQRHQMLVPGVLTIYGPPGTRRLVDGLTAAMTPLPFPSLRRGIAPEVASTVRVVEVRDGATFTIGDVTVTAATNSHYSAAEANQQFDSLAFRFDTPGRSIAYTGDTGPSANVERLARDVDLLISEVLDIGATLNQIRRSRPDMTPPVLLAVRKHFEQEHLSPEQAGLLAMLAGAKALVLTHDATDPGQISTLRAAVAVKFKGRIAFARDLETF